tara:strand:- start:3398 stop:4483 length:1086 start_codon:yes stop_codon:yes gene_type:complete
MNILFFIFFIFFIIFVIFNINNKNIKGGRKMNENHLVIKNSCDILKNKYNIDIYYEIKGNIMDIYCNNKDIRFKNGYNNLKKKYIYKNSKVSIGNKLKKYNFPVPRNQMIDKIKTKNDVDNIINNNNIGYPLVVKPIDGNNAYNVYTNINNNKQLKKILIEKFLNKKLKRCNKCNLMLEEHLYGKQYRLLLYKNNILDILEMIPSYIIGDGVNNIKDLILIENNKEKNKAYPLIMDKHFLEVKNLNVNSILNKNEKLTINLPKGRLGCTYKRIDKEKIHKDNIIMFENLYKIAGFDFIGVDFIINNLYLSYKNDINKNGGINELNSSPSVAPHYFSKDIKPDYTVPINFLISYFELNEFII